jgi:hypothetical protein
LFLGAPVDEVADVEGDAEEIGGDETELGGANADDADDGAVDTGDDPALPELFADEHGGENDQNAGQIIKCVDWGERPASPTGVGVNSRRALQRLRRKGEKEGRAKARPYKEPADGSVDWGELHAGGAAGGYERCAFDQALFQGRELHGLCPDGLEPIHEESKLGQGSPAWLMNDSPQLIQFVRASQCGMAGLESLDVGFDLAQFMFFH